jgi:hypothetical protein
MKKFSFVFVLICVLITTGIVSACQTTVSTPELALTNTDTPTKAVVSTNTQIARDYPAPSKTPVPTKTERIEPSGTAYFLTPTSVSWQTREALTAESDKYSSTPYVAFDPHTVFTITPASPAICPHENPDFSFNEEMTIPLETYDRKAFIDLSLNAGASFQQIEERSDFLDGVRESIYLQDLTGDGIDELVVESYGMAGIAAFACDYGKYRMILDYSASSLGAMSSPFIVSVEDLNLDNQSEIVIKMSLSTGANTTIDVLSWDGYQFVSNAIANRGYTSKLEPRLANGLYWYYGKEADWWNYNDYPFAMNFNASITVKDTDNNGTKEVILNDDGPVHHESVWVHGPWRGQEITFAWDGNAFVLSDYRIDPAEYRFQALQEADRAFMLRDYERALQLYDEVINNTTLKPWSPEYMAYLRDAHYAENPSSIVKPEMTLDEYQQLSAYARYRVMMIQLAQGKQAEALNSYQFLDQIYTEDNPGFFHAEIGRTYWAAVENGNDLIEACQVVTAYMGEHQNLLAALGDAQHGGQSHEYVVEDICPLDETDIALLSGDR